MVAGNDAAARGRARVQRRARHLPPGPVRHAARRHRRRDRRRPGPPQRRAARPRRRRLSRPHVKLDAATFLLQWATGGLAVLLGHDPPPRGEPRLRLAAPQRLRRAWRSARRVLFATERLDGARSLALAAAIGVVLARGGRARGVGRPPRARACAAARRCAPSARRASRRWSARDAADDAASDEPTARVPTRARSRRARVRRDRGLLAAAVFAGGPYALAAARLARRRGVPRRGDRRDAARPLVPRAARPAARRR